ncbi:MAG: FtsX-like permease family protein [Acidobacteriota bacterium]
MKATTLLRRSLMHYWRSHLAVVIAVAAAVAVLAGALVVGDSVRTSLRDLFVGRLGRTDTVLQSTGYFREALAADLQSQPGFTDTFDATCPLIEIPGIVIHQSTSRRASRVRIYGVDGRFWRFHGRSSVRSPASQEIFVSPALARRLDARLGDALVVRVEKPSEIPIESLHGRKEERTRALRATLRAALANEDLGEFSVEPTQSEVLAAFLPLDRMQRELEVQGQVNTVLIVRRAGSGIVSSANSSAELAALLRKAVTLDDLSIRVRPLDGGAARLSDRPQMDGGAARVSERPQSSEKRRFALEAASGLLGDELASAGAAAAAHLQLKSSPVLTYLANTMRVGDAEIPYSLVAAVDPELFGEVHRQSQFAGDTRPNSPQGGLQDLPPLLLNDWAARDLDAQLGSKISLEYFLWHGDGRLDTEYADFRVAGVIPLTGMARDPDFAPTYPGISDAGSLKQWDPPFPMNLARIRTRDEEYWDRYRTAPKAFIRLSDGQKLWSSRFGNITSLRVAAGNNLSETIASYRGQLQSSLDPLRLGMSLVSVRALGLQAAHGTTDFGEYFLYFSFFLVVSALLLAGLFFKLGVEQRLREIGLLRAVGFSPQHVRNGFLREGLVLSLAGSLLGAAGAAGYGALVLAGLRSWWVDAVGTRLLSLHVSTGSLLAGIAGGMIAAIVAIAWTLRRMAAAPPRALLSGRLPRQVGSRQVLAPVLLVITLLVATALLLILAVLKWMSPTAGFFGAGMLLLVAALAAARIYLHQGGIGVHGVAGWWPIIRIGFRNASERPGRSLACIALVAFASFLIVAVDVFRRGDSVDASDPKSGTGGYTLVAEALLSVAYDPNDESGRDALNLPQADASPALAFTPFRVRPGEDASCLNLYRPSNPRILGARASFLRANRFSFSDSTAEAPEEQSNPWLLLERSLPDGAIPVVGDANSMTYVLHLGLGDELVIGSEGEKPVRLRLVGVLRDSLFQSELVMSEANFLRVFPEQEGYRLFLVETPAPLAGQTGEMLEERLSDYGVNVQTTVERLAEFHRVENTYLSTFQMLGGLGLLLGTIGLAAVLWRNALERRRELAVLRAVGYRSAHLVVLALAENALLLVYGLVAGAVCALVAVVPALLARGGGLATASPALLLGVLATGLAASTLVALAVLRLPLLASLRSE